MRSLPAERLEAHETHIRIREAIDNLPDAQREVLTMRDIEEMDERRGV